MSQEATGTEFDADLDPEQPATSRRSRSRGPGRGKKVTEVTKREFIEDESEDDADDEIEQLPGIFAMADVEGKSIVRIRVYRRDPEEGMLGYVNDPNTSEEEIQRQWGGGQFMLQGLNNIGKIVKVVTVRLAGDPIFVSESARQDWEKRRGIRTQPVGQPAAEQLSLRETLTLMQQMNQERAQQEEQRLKREAAERREHEERMRKLELEAEERRRKDEMDREERRRRDENEREERRRKEAAEADQRSRAHLDTMMALMRQSSEQALSAVKQQAGGGIMETVKMVVAIKEAFAGESASAEPPDALNLLIQHGAEWLQAAGNAVGGAIREVKGGGAVPPQQVVGQPKSPQLPAANPSGDNLVIPRTSPIASRLEKLAGTIASKGQNPEQVLAMVMDNLQSTLDGQPAPTQPAPPKPAESPRVADTPAAASAVSGERPKPTVEKTSRGSGKISFAQA